MTIRTGILCVPQLDEASIAAILALLRRQQLQIVMIHESSARSQRNWIEDLLRRWCDEDELDLILTIGGTMPAPGPSSFEIVPEATQLVLERTLPGFSETMRAHGWEQTPLALLDRGLAGIRGRTLILNLPAGAAASVLFLEAVVELIPALLAHLQEAVAAPLINDELEIVEDESAISPVSAAPKQVVSGLDAEEFAKFLLRKGSEQR